MSDQPTDQPSYILIKFAEPGSVQVQVNISGVTPLQLLAAAAYLEVKGKNSLIMEENERLEHERQQKLSIPKPTIAVATGR